MASGTEPTGVGGTPLKARWTRAASRVCLPLPETPRADILLYFTAPPAGTSGVARLTLTPQDGVPVTRTVPVRTWMWESWRIETGLRRGAGCWLTIRTEPSWNSGVRGFPTDLGVLLGGIAVIPVETPEPKETSR
jgi:hypothetical protein